MVRFGVVNAQLRGLFLTTALRIVTERRFILDGQEYPYAWHRKGAWRAKYLWEPGGTWRSERVVELPIAIAAAKEVDPARTLEVGNVLRGYTDLSHAVIDKYERAPAVENVDAETFQGGPYDLIVSVSTIEHIGFDETPRDPGKVIRAVENLRGLLAPGGQMVATVPLRYNRDLDDVLTGGALEADVSYLVRRANSRRWRQASREDALELIYGWPWPGASAIAVAKWGV